MLVPPTGLGPPPIGIPYPPLVIICDIIPHSSFIEGFIKLLSDNDLLSQLHVTSSYYRSKQHVQWLPYRAGKFNYFLGNNATVESRMLHHLT